MGCSLQRRGGVAICHLGWAIHIAQPGRRSHDPGGQSGRWVHRIRSHLFRAACVAADGHGEFALAGWGGRAGGSGDCGNAGAVDPAWSDAGPAIHQSTSRLQCGFGNRGAAFCGANHNSLSYFMAEKTGPSGALDVTSALDPALLDRPQRAVDSAARELLGMGQKIEQMLIAVDPLYDQWNVTTASMIADQDKAIKQTHLDIKLYLARLGQKGMDEDLSRRSLELASISSSLDSASDAITRTMLDLAERLHRQKLQFSQQGRDEIRDFTDRVQSNAKLALNVMMNQNPAEARELVAAKDKVRKVEQKLQRSHIGRLREGLVESIETSNIHQETLRALKQVNNAFSMVGYPILHKSGDLLKSRLA